MCLYFFHIICIFTFKCRSCRDLGLLVHFSLVGSEESVPKGRELLLGYLHVTLSDLNSLDEHLGGGLEVLDGDPGAVLPGGGDPLIVGDLECRILCLGLRALALWFLYPRKTT